MRCIVIDIAIVQKWTGILRIAVYTEIFCNGTLHSPGNEHGNCIDSIENMYVKENYILAKPFQGYCNCEEYGPGGPQVATALQTVLL